MKDYIVEVSFKAIYSAESEEDARQMVDDDCRLGECYDVSISSTETHNFAQSEVSE